MEPLMLGIICMVLYVLAVIAMIRGLSTFMALFIMGIAWAVIVGLPTDVLMKGVIDAGWFWGAKLSYTVAMGAWLGQIMLQTGIVDTLIRNAVELGGDRPILVSVLITIVVSFIFTTLLGTGPSIAVGLIVFPILTTIGIDNVVAAGIFSMAYGAGKFMNAALYALYQPVVLAEYSELFHWMLPATAIWTIIACIATVVRIKRSGIRKGYYIPAPASVQTTKPRFSLMSGPRVTEAVKRKVAWYAMITPAVPIALIVLLKIPFITAFYISIAYALLATQGSKIFSKETYHLLHKTVVDGFPDVAVIALVNFGVGTMVVVVTQPQVFDALAAVFNPIIPKTIFTTCVFFAAFCWAAVYRGPLLYWGAGAALAAIMVKMAYVPGAVLGAMFMITQNMHSGTDPVHSTNVWVTAYMKVKGTDFAKGGILWCWLAGAIVAILAYFLF